MRGLALAAVGLLFLTPLAAAARGVSRSWTSAARWSEQTIPKPGPAHAIGSYNAGCLQGAVALAPEGTGYEVLHLHRRRFFGHPSLLRFVHRLAESAARRGLPALLVGDLAQPRGGPTPSDHGSHQSGLDVDIAYIRPAAAQQQPLGAAEREELEFPAVVDVARRTLEGSWNPRVSELLELAASDPDVDRIFVNAVIKQELCSSQAQAPWLARLRPWWGHHDHFHVRLKCPAADQSCQPQQPVPAGNGCDETLAWWLTDAASAEAAKLRHGPHAEAPRLPAECRAVLD
jgi:penicillin-insensitive murein endopeptidase